MHVRWMIRRDLAEVLQLAPEITEADLIADLRQRFTIGMVVEQQERICGFMVYNLHKNCLYVHKLKANGGAALSAMVYKLIDKLSSHKRRKIHVDLDIGSTFLLNFLKKTYFHGRLLENDIVRMSYVLPRECKVEQAAKLTCNR